MKKITNSWFGFDKIYKEKILIGAFFLMTMMSVTNMTFNSLLRLRHMAPVYMLLFIIIIMCVIDKKPQLCKVKKTHILIWLVFSISFIISGIINSYQYLICGIIFAVFVPILIICANNCDDNRIYIGFAKGNLFAFYIMAVTSFLFVSVDSMHGYGGIVHNPNLFGHYLGVFLACSLYLYNSTIEKRRKVVLIITMSLVMAFLLLTRSRTSILTAAIAVLVWILLSITKIRDVKQLFKRILLISCVVGISTVVFFSMITINGSLEYLINNDHHFHVENHMEEDDVKISIDSLDENNIKSQEEKTGNFLDIFLNKFSINGKNISEYSNGRIYIWSRYIEQLNFSGHDLDYRFDIEGYDFTSAHNTVLQVSYENGLICGVALLGYLFVTMISIVIYAFKEDSNELVILNNISFYMVMLLASVHNPIIYVPATAFIFMQAPLWKK